MTVAGKLIEGEIPTVQELVDNAAILLAMHAGISGIQNISSIKAQLQKGFVEEGIHPKTIVNEIVNKPVQGDLSETIDNIISEVKQSKPKQELAPKSSQETLPSDASSEISKTSGQGSAKVTESMAGKEALPVDATRDISEKTGDGKVQSGETSIKNAVVDAERIARGEEPIERPIIKEVSPEKVKEMVDSGELDTRSMAKKINNLVEFGEPVPALTTEWSDAFAYDKKRLQNESKTIEKEIDEYSGEGKNMPELERRRNEIDLLLDENEKATTAIGTSWSGIGRSRQQQISEDYSFSGMILRAKKDGIEITPQVRKRLKGLSNKIEKAQKELDDFNSKSAADNFDKSIEILKNEEGLKQRKQKRSIKKEEIDAEFDDIVKKLNKQLSNQFNVGLDPVAVKYMVDLARNRIKKGIVSAEGIVDEIYIALKNAGIEFSKREIRDSISGYGLTKNMSKEEISVALREAKRQMQLISALEDAKKGEAPLKSGLQRDKPSNRVRELQREVTQAMREAGIQKGKTPEEQWKTSLDAVKTRLSNHIVDLARRLETGIKEPKKPGIVYDERANELKALRDKVQKVLDFVEDTKGKKELSPEQKIKMAMASAEKSLAEYERRIDEKDLAAKKKPSTTPVTPELEALRKDRDLLKEVYNMMKAEAKPKRTPEEIALKSFRTRTENQIKDFEGRLAEKDFAPKTKKPPVTLGKTELDLRFELDKVKREYAKQRVEYQKENRSTAKKITDGMVEAINLSRAIKTSLDLSAVLRQGGFIFLGHPVRGVKALPAMFKSLRSVEGQFAVEQEILRRKNYPLYEKSKLYLAEHGQKLSEMEEVFMSTLAEKIPGVAGSQRAYTAYLNRLRADSFDKMVETLSQKGKPTTEETTAIANYINVATGRGNAGLKANAMVGLNTVFFAPRYVLSRFQILAGQPLYKGTANTRGMIAKEYGRFLAGLSVVYALGLASGATVETDPRSTDFGKIKFGNTRVDPLAGLVQTTVLLSRVATGETKKPTGLIVPLRGDYVPYNSMNTADVIANFLRSKLSPVVGTSVDVLAGKDVVGGKVALETMPGKLLMPLALSDIYESMVDQGVPVGAALGVLSIFGMGLQTYEPR